MADSSNGALAKQNQLLDQQVHQMIAQHLTGLGLQEVTENPDQVISYDASTKENHQLNTIPMGVGFGIGWRRFGGMGMATTTETTFTEGTLVIDSYTPSGKQMLWRGIRSLRFPRIRKKPKRISAGPWMSFSRNWRKSSPHD